MQISSAQLTRRSNRLFVQAQHHHLVQNPMTKSLWQNISRIQGQKNVPFVSFMDSSVLNVRQSKNMYSSNNILSLFNIYNAQVPYYVNVYLS